jgi:thiol-disulfide isomerase/thioredoxin
MTKPTLLALSAIAGLIVVAGVVASRGPAKFNFEMGRASLGSTSTGQIATNTVPGMPSKLPVLAPAMPEFQGITKWYNTADGQALTPASLKGKVVLIDFWTYSCINCIRTMPFLRSLHEKYADKGLVIVGVHTPEFAFEGDPKNVGAAITKNGLKYPVALDADYGTWNAYHNQYWPAEYLFDAQGQLRHVHFGEGEYEASESAIRELLAENAVKDLGTMGVEMDVPQFANIETHETYFGLARGEAFMGTAGANGKTVTLKAASTVESNKWTAGGSWIFTDEYVEAAAAGDIFRFNVQANKAHIVMASNDGKDKQIEVYVDGVKVKSLTINASQLYTVAEFPQAGRHTIEIRIKNGGVRFYAATFS